MNQLVYHVIVRTEGNMYSVGADDFSRSSIEYSLIAALVLQLWGVLQQVLPPVSQLSQLALETTPKLLLFLFQQQHSR